MYRCFTCDTLSKVGQSRLLHRVNRSDGSVLREYPVCPGCKALLDRNLTTVEVLRGSVNPKSQPTAKASPERKKSSRVPVTPTAVATTQPAAPVNPTEPTPKPIVYRAKVVRFN